MSVNEIVLSDYFYPFNQLSEQDFISHRFIKLPQHCCVSSAFVKNGNYESIFTALKVDKLRLLKKLIETKHITEIWLKFCSNISYKSFMFFNINIKYGYKICAGTKVVYGHNALLIIPSDNDKTVEISKYIETHFRQENLLSKVFDCFGAPFFLLFPKSQSTNNNNNYFGQNTTVHLLFNFTKELNVSLSQTLKDLKRLVQKPLNIIGLDPHEISTENFDQHECAGDMINIILMALKIRYLIEKEFPICTTFSAQDKIKINTVISEISTEQLKLSTALGLKRSHEGKQIITEIYKNISTLLNFIFLEYKNFFSQNENDSAVIFPKIPFAEILLEDLKKIFQPLKQNFSIFNEKIFFKWNESTRYKIAGDERDDEINPKNYGIIVTEESFETLKEMFENFGNNIFWALNLSVNFNNIEPLIFIASQETLFGFVEGIISSAQDKNFEQNENVEELLLFTPCNCSCIQFRHWICKNCWSLMKILILEDSECCCCECGIQKIGSLEKECFQCILNSKSNVSRRSSRRRKSEGSKNFKEARDQLSNFFKLQDPPKKRPKKLFKKVEIIPPDPHISSSSPSASTTTTSLKSPTKLASLKSAKIPPPLPPPVPIVSESSKNSDEITIALEQLHETVKVATELCEDVLQKVSKKEIHIEIPKIDISPEAEFAVKTPIGDEPLKILKQKVEEALEHVEEIKEHEQSKTNSEA